MPTSLPTHPLTGLTALGLRRDGRPIWPVLGGAEPAPPKNDPPADPPADPPKTGDGDDKPLGRNGEKALRAEREAREALEKQIKELEPLKGLADLKPLAELLGGKSTGNPKTDLEQLTERMSQLEQTASTERLGRLRLEVAAEKGLSPQQAARLQGGSREELTADADALLALFPVSPATTRPKPDPSQGSKGIAPDLDAQIREAESKGEWLTAVALKNQKLTTK